MGRYSICEGDVFLELTVYTYICICTCCATQLYILVSFPPPFFYSLHPSLSLAKFLFPLFLPPALLTFTSLPFLPSHLSQVQYHGLIKQATGEDWKDAKISLSTAQPSIGGSAPPLPTRIIRFKRPPPRIMPVMRFSRGFGGGSYHATGFDEYDPTIEDSYCQDEFRALNLEDQLEDLALESAQFSSKTKKMRKGGGFGWRRSSVSPPPSPPALNIEVAQVIEG